MVGEKMIWPKSVGYYHQLIRGVYFDGKTPYYVFFNFTGNDSQMIKLHH